MRGPRHISVGLLAIAITSALVATAGSAHDFDETRHLVLSAEANHLELLVAYEVRPSRRADGLVGRFDSDHDGRATSSLERLARAQTIAPRLRHGLELVVDGRPVTLSLESLAFPAPPVEAGRSGVAAVALYAARLPRRARAGAPLPIVIRTRNARGQVTLEAQAAEGYDITGTGLESRSGDPVIGPAVLSRTGALTLSVARRAR